MRVCAFCGRTFTGRTKDHVPPRALFGEDPGYHLITVPACRDCNGGSSKDDEFFRLLALEYEASRHPTALAVQQSIRRAFHHPKKVGFRRFVERNLVPATIYSLAGLYVKPGVQLNVNVGRLMETGRKIVRGLFYHLKSRPLPEGYKSYCVFLENVLVEWPRALVDELEDVILPALVPQPAVVIGPGVFGFRHVTLSADPNLIFLLMELYDRYQFLGFTLKLDATPEVCG